MGEITSSFLDSAGLCDGANVDWLFWETGGGIICGLL